jgi:hypothetical protein
MSFIDNAVEAGFGLAEDIETVAGEAPGIGTIVNGTESLYYDAKAGLDVLKDDPESAYEDASKAGAHALKAIPFVGTGLSAYDAYNEETGHKKNSIEEQVGETAFGPKPESTSGPKSHTGEDIGMTLGTVLGPLGMIGGGLIGSLFD